MKNYLAGGRLNNQIIDVTEHLNNELKKAFGNTFRAYEHGSTITVEHTQTVGYHDGELHHNMLKILTNDVDNYYYVISNLVLMPKVKYTDPTEMVTYIVTGLKPYIQMGEWQ